MKAAWLLLALGACANATRPSPVAPSQGDDLPPGPSGAHTPSAGAAPPGAESVSSTPDRPAANEFLVLTDAGELLAKTPEGASRVLAKNVADASYDPEPELIWLQTRDELQVYDLRKPAAVPVTIARGFEGPARLQVTHGESFLLPDDGCDLPFVELDWTEAPTIQGIIEELPALELTSARWLSTELNRSRRPVSPGRMSEFDLRASTERVRLPKKLLSCEEPSTCGAAVRFGKLPMQLVLVSDHMGGDCWERACILREAESGRVAAPPLAQQWTSVQAVTPGPCGPYQFDADGTSFLDERSLCAPATGCKDIGGRALGWRNPGPTVGIPGTFASNE